MSDLEPDGLFEAPPIDEEAPAAAKPATARKRTKKPPVVVPPSSFFEYPAPDGKPWRCDAPDKLFEDFGFVGDIETRRADLTRFHATVAAVRESWDVIRRVYRLAPVIGADKDDLREWTIDEIARESSVPVKRVESVVAEAQVFWQRKCNELSLVTKAVEGPTVEALDNLDDDQIVRLLAKHGFEEVPPSQHRYMARRIIEFQHLLDDEQGSHLARSALMEELMLLDYDRQIRLAMGRPIESRSQKALDDLIARRSSLQTSYGNTLERLGATQEQNPGYRAKVAFGDSLGHLAKSMQAYYAESDNTLIDGLHTAAEIKLLMTPALNGLRPAQYRPDLAMLVSEWRANFWNPKWEGAKLPRDVHRFLLATFNKASVEFAAGNVDGEMSQEEVESGEVEMAVAEAADGGVVDAGSTGIAEASADEMALPAPMGSGAAAVRGARGDDFGGWIS